LRLSLDCLEFFALHRVPELDATIRCSTARN
jgi:hypothetical protein